MFTDTRTFKKPTRRQLINRARKAHAQVIEKYPPPTAIGRFVNNWRQRTVLIFEHTDPALVIAVGVPFDETVAPIVTVEPRADYAAYIGTFTKVYD